MGASSRPPAYQEIRDSAGSEKKRGHINENIGRFILTSPISCKARQRCQSQGAEKWLTEKESRLIAEVEVWSSLVIFHEEKRKGDSTICIARG